MVRPSERVNTKFHQGFTNGQCEFLPCHRGVRKEFNCLFCYCPLVFLRCPGPYRTFTDKGGLTRKDCSGCILPHNGYEQSWAFIQKWLARPEPWDGAPGRTEAGEAG